MSITKDNTFRLAFEIGEKDIGMSMLWVEKNLKMPVPKDFKLDSPEDVKLVARILFPSYDAQLRAIKDEAEIKKLKTETFFDELQPEIRTVTVQGRTGEEHELTIHRSGKISCSCWAYIKWNKRQGCHHIDEYLKKHPVTKKANEQYTIEQVEYMCENADAIEAIFRKQRMRELFKK